MDLKNSPKHTSPARNRRIVSITVFGERCQKRCLNARFAGKTAPVAVYGIPDSVAGQSLPFQNDRRFVKMGSYLRTGEGSRQDG